MHLYIGNAPKDLVGLVTLEFQSADKMGLTEDERDDLLRDTASKFLLKGRPVLIPIPYIKKESKNIEEDEEKKQKKYEALKNLCQTTNASLHV